MKNIDFDKVWIGIVAGLLAPTIALWLYYFINYSQLTIWRFIDKRKLGDTYTPLISLCVLANLAVFYPFKKKEKWRV